MFVECVQITMPADAEMEKDTLSADQDRVFWWVLRQAHTK